MTGGADFSHLKANRWYHLTVAWDRPQQRLEAYLNGILQQALRPRPSREQLDSTALRLGGTLGQGAGAIRFAVDSIRLYDRFLDETQLAATLEGRNLPPVEGEGRPAISGALDLSAYELKPIYEADFSGELNVVDELDLFDGDRRVRLPAGKEWVLEGEGRAWTENGLLHVETTGDRNAGHLVLWSTRRFPDDILIEWEMSPRDSADGLTIIFFAARPKDNPAGSIFDVGMPKRDGLFKNYHTGALNNYHCSYWAGPRRTANLRKNHGFFLTTCGVDRIMGQGPGPHKVRLLKAGGAIRLEIRGQLAVTLDDDGRRYGPVWTDGYIGLRQMGHTRKMTYSSFKVYEVKRR
jgi:hypothetical protein